MYQVLCYFLDDRSLRNSHCPPRAYILVEKEKRPNAEDKLLEGCTEGTVRALKMSTGWSVMASEYNHTAISNLQKED